MGLTFADRLVAAIDRCGTPACVGLDPVHDRLPAELRLAGTDPARSFVQFGNAVIEAVAPLVSTVKINVAFFEPLGGAGLDAYFELVRSAREHGLIVIGDVKRGDIGHSSAAYARAHLAAADQPGADAVTVSGYLGIDGVRPFLDVAAAEGKGVFVLVHTSNPSAGEVQHAALADGGVVADLMARRVADWAQADGLTGTEGWSSVGAVVAPADVSTARRLRGLMPGSYFLVPGFGAQGRSVEQIAACFDERGAGAIVNSSRGIIYAYARPEMQSRFGDDWRACIQQACTEFVAALQPAHACR